MRHAVLAQGHGFLRAARAAQFFGERGKSQRRRILVDPASEFLDAWAVRHGDSVVQRTAYWVVACAYGPAVATSTGWLVVAVRPLLSVTVSVTVKVPSVVY
jgi:hypothetical protein